MQSKLCLAVALIVLIGALVGGNPFLVCGEGVPLRAGSSGAAPSDPPSDPKVDPKVPRTPPASLAAEPASPTAELVRRSAAGTNPAADRLVDAVAFRPAKGVAKGDALLDRQRSEPAKAAVEPCPDVSLRPLVERVRHGADGRPIWVLRDGRQVRKNLRSGPGQPLVVPIEGPPVVPGAGAPGGGEQAHEDDGR